MKYSYLLLLGAALTLTACGGSDSILSDNYGGRSSGNYLGRLI